MSNNYDQSSTGIHVEFGGHYSIHMAQLYCDEFINGSDVAYGRIVRNSGVDYVVLVDDAEECPWTWRELRSMNKDELLDILDVVDDAREPEWYTRAELEKDIKYGVDWHDWVSGLASYYHWGEFPNEWWGFYVHGYCQGDVIRVLDARRKHGPEDQSTLRERLRHLFYDCPIAGVLDIVVDDPQGDEVHEEEIYLDEVVDMYDYWDRDDFLKALREKFASVSERVLEQVKSVIPEALEYT